MQQIYDFQLKCYVNSEDYMQQNHDQAALGILNFTLKTQILGKLE